MATTRDIKISVYEETKEKGLLTHLERQSILNLEDKKTNTYHSADAIDADTVQSMINSFGLNPTKLKFEIGWRPPQGKSVLFNNLKSSTNTLTIYIYWTIKESDKLTYSKNVVIKGGKVNKPAVSKGTAPNAIQYVEFTASSFVPSKG